MPAARRSPGEGSIYPTPDGRWTAQIEVGYTKAGNRRYKRRTAPTKKAAQLKLKQLIADQATGDTTLDPRTTMRAWCTQWLDMQTARHRPRTIQTNRGSIDKWLTPTIGHKRLTELTPADLRKIDKAMHQAGRSDTTIHNVRSLTRTILTDAVREGHTVPRAVLTAEIPRPGANPRAALPLPDAALLLEAATRRATWPPPTPTGDHAHDIKIARDHRRALETDQSRWLAALMAGMRQAECLGLTWDAIDWAHDTIHVDRQLQALPDTGALPPGYQPEQIDGRYFLTDPKSAAGDRTIPMVGWLRNALEQWREICPASPHNLVWPAPDGSPRHKHADLAAFRGLQRAAGVSRTPDRLWLVHELRHTTVSVLVAADVPIPVIIAIVGHSTFASTAHYTHTDLTQARDALQQVADRLQISA